MLKSRFTVVFLSALATSMLFTTSVSAEKYGAAGCGLGSLIIKKKGFVQVFASTTNGTSGSQTFGISSGTSNCAPSASEEGTQAYVETNREALAKEIARGRGETVATLGKVAGCKNNAQVPMILQRNYSRIFSNAARSDKEVGRAVVSTLKSHDKTLQCKALSS